MKKSLKIMLSALLILSMVMIIPLAFSLNAGAAAVAPVCNPLNSSGTTIGTVPGGYVGTGTAITSSSSLTDSGTFKLTGNIASWSTVSGFTGTLDGCGYTITTSVPLFADNTSCTIKNLNVIANISRSGVTGALIGNANTTTVQNVHVSGSVAGTDDTAGLIGYVKNGHTATMSYCWNEATISTTAYSSAGILANTNGTSSAAILQYCYNTGNVSNTGTTSNCGTAGIIGKKQRNATIDDCQNYGTISGTSTAVGGIAGYFMNTETNVRNCINVGNVTAQNGNAGGMLGQQVCTVNFFNCQNYGTITANIATSALKAGGMVGYINGNRTCRFDWYDGSSGKVSGVTTHSTNYGTVNAQSFGGGFIGGADGSSYWVTACGCVNEGAVNAHHGGGFIGWASSGKSTVQMLGITNRGNITGTLVGGLAGTFNLAADQSVENCINEGIITGNGNAKTGGIVGYAYNAIAFTNCENKATGTVIGGADVTGGIVGYTEGAATFTNCTNRANVTGSSHTGGFVGKINNNTDIRNGNNYGTVTANLEVAAIGGGGFVGYLNGKVCRFDYYNAGDGTSGVTSHSTNYGTVNAQSFGGGFIGQAEGGAWLQYHHSVNEGAINAHNGGGFVGHCVGSMMSDFDHVTNNGDVTGGIVGGIVGNFSSTHESTAVTGCTNNGDINSTGIAGGLFAKVQRALTYTDCTNTGDVHGATQTGGIVGYITAGDLHTFTNNTNTGAITSSGNAAGIVGQVDAGATTILSSTNEGNVTTSGEIAGGLLGYAQAVDVQKCISKGNVRNNALENGKAAGLVGYSNNNSSVFKNNAVAGNVTLANAGIRSALVNVKNTNLDEYTEVYGNYILDTADLGNIVVYGGSGSDFSNIISALTYHLRFTNVTQIDDIIEISSLLEGNLRSEGASIKLKDGNQSGMRFKNIIDRATVDALRAYGTIEFGTIMAPGTKFNKRFHSVFEDANIANATNRTLNDFVSLHTAALPSYDANNYFFYGTITYFPVEGKLLAMDAVPYIIIDGVYYYGTAQLGKSISSVASSVMDNAAEFEGYSEAFQNIIRGFVAKSVSVMTYNVYHGESGENASLIQQEIMLYNPDVFGCQEVEYQYISGTGFGELSKGFDDYFTTAVLKYANARGDATNANFYTPGATTSSQRNDIDCNIIYYKTDKFDRLAGGMYYLDAPASGTLKTSFNSSYKANNHYRTAAWVLLEDQESHRQMIFINTHLQNGEPGDREGAVINERYNEIRNLIRVTDQLRSTYPGTPIILMGDMNIRYNNSNDLFTMITEGTNGPAAGIASAYAGGEKTWNHTDYYALALDDARTLKYENVPIFSKTANYFTFLQNGFDEKVESVETVVNSQCLDYIFYTDDCGLVVSEYGTLYANISTTAGNVKYASDHMPVFAKFEY